VAAVAGAAGGELAGGPGGGLLGGPQLAPVQGQQRPDTEGVDQAVALAGLGGQGQGRLQLGQGVVPFAGQEPFGGQPLLVAGERPAHAVPLAAAPAGLQERPGLLQPVQLDEDVAPGPDQQREAVSLPPGVEAGRPQAVTASCTARWAVVAAPSRSPRETLAMLGHLQGGRARAGQPLAGLAVQGPADSRGKVLVDGLVQQVVEAGAALPRRRGRRGPGSSSAARGDGRRQATTATGTSARRPPRVPIVSRLDGSAHCRSSRPATSGPARASCSIRSPKASTAWNWRPGSLLTVSGPRPRPGWPAARPAPAGAGRGRPSRPRARCATPSVHV